MALSAQSLDYTLNLTNEGGKAISNATLFVEIGRTGKIMSVEILKQNNPRAARVVKRAIYRSPRWTPGTENGKPVNVSYTLPVNLHGTAGY